MLGWSASTSQSTTGLALLPASAGVGGDIPVVSKWVLYRCGTFIVVHFTHLVKTYSPSPQGAVIGRIHVANIEMEGCRHCLPLARSPAALDNATLDAKGYVHDLSVVSRPPLLSQFLRSKGRPSKLGELAWVLHGDERGHGREPWRCVLFDGQRIHMFEILGSR